MTDPIEQLRQILSEIVAENEWLSVTEKKLYKLILEYGQHKRHCLYETDSYPCNCGFGDIQAQIKNLSEDKNLT